MKIILIIFLLNVESSYIQNTERETKSHTDTIQFLLVGNQAWRIKTYAIDQDVHVWDIGKLEQEKFEEIAVANTKKHYGDVLKKQIAVQGAGDFESLRSVLKTKQLPPNLEIDKNKRFAFWVPEPDKYSSKSTPTR